MGAVVETPAVYLDMSAEENLKQQSLMLGLPTYEHIPEILKLVGLSDAGRKKRDIFLSECVSVSELQLLWWETPIF